MVHHISAPAHSASSVLQNQRWARCVATEDPSKPDRAPGGDEARERPAPESGAERAAHEECLEGEDRQADQCAGADRGVDVVPGKAGAQCCAEQDARRESGQHGSAHQSQPEQKGFSGHRLEAHARERRAPTAPRGEAVPGNRLTGGRWPDDALVASARGDARKVAGHHEMAPPAIRAGRVPHCGHAGVKDP